MKEEVTKMDTRMPNRRGYILAVVLGLTAVMTALGMTYLAANSTAMPESVNRYGSLRALYIAESGAAVASRYLMWPPTGVALSSYWTGATSMAVDTSNDRMNISVTQPTVSEKNLFRITSTGLAYGPTGESRGKRSITSDVIVPNNGKWVVLQGFIGTSTMVIPTELSVTGDMHVNGSLTGTGWCNGQISSTGTTSWSGSGPPTAIVSSASSVSVPTTTVSKYSSYTIRGVTYTGYTYNSFTMTSSDATGLNATDMSSNNPGRVIMAKNGNQRCRASASITGCLVVNGNLEVDDTSSTRKITAVDGFPALVVTGDIKFLADNAVLNVDGPVICNGKVDTNSRDGPKLNITGCFICRTTFAMTGTNDAVVVTYDLKKSQFWDLDNPWTANDSRNKPITVLNWQEN